MDVCIGEGGKYSSEEDTGSESLGSDGTPMFDLPIFTLPLSPRSKHGEQPRQAVLGCGVVVEHPSLGPKPMVFGLIPLHCLFRDPVRKKRLFVRVRNRVRSHPTERILRAVESIDWQISFDTSETEHCEGKTILDNRAQPERSHPTVKEIGRVITKGSSRIQSTTINAEQDWALVDLSPDLTADIADGSERSSFETAPKQSLNSGEYELVHGGRRRMITRAPTRSTFASFPGSSKPTEVWAVQVKTEQGSSGSWVIDRSDGKIVGMIVGTSANATETYVVPAKDIMASLRSTLPPTAQVRLDFDLPARIYQTLQPQSKQKLAKRITITESVPSQTHASMETCPVVHQVDNPSRPQSVISSSNTNNDRELDPSASTGQIGLFPKHVPLRLELNLQDDPTSCIIIEKDKFCLYDHSAVESLVNKMKKTPSWKAEESSENTLLESRGKFRKHRTQV
ncbi:hypothetical protein H2198_005023 [Neophaeococcomyces mojaviensis]|uniref:Uncharacterized protein n=1 Tax=Neophaeococcomyces mojaviensis TaxID=3383035 RepID=A0ACC3A7E1_9EURO|nr:hypothetical protein H2198_005023 [Knufia sp. JES_112]